MPDIYININEWKIVFHHLYTGHVFAEMSNVPSAFEIIAKKIVPGTSGSVHWIYLSLTGISVGTRQSHCADGWMTCNFTSFSTVFQTYQDDERLTMKGCMCAMESRLRLRRFRLQLDSNSRPLDQ